MEWPSRGLTSFCKHAGQSQVLGRMVASFREFRAGLESGIAQRIGYCKSGPEAVAHCVTGHIRRVWGQSAAFVQRILCLEESGYCWIWGFGPQEGHPAHGHPARAGQDSLEELGVNCRSHFWEVVWYSEAGH